jgi:NAD(P)H dehydrogenase (quinone)
MKEILVLYYSNNGHTKKIANLIARGIESVGHIKARIRTVPSVSTTCEQTMSAIPEDGDVYVTLNDLKECIGLALGSPVHFGKMASHLKYFFDSTTHEWLSGTLSGKPACVFTSSGSMHGGQEACLWSMLIPLMHHGMVIVGIPYVDSKLMETNSGGTPYGVSHHAGIDNDIAISEDEKHLAIIQGRRLAEIALKLNRSNN